MKWMNIHLHNIFLFSAGKIKDVSSFFHDVLFLAVSPAYDDWFVNKVWGAFWQIDPAAQLYYNLCTHYYEVLCMEYLKAFYSIILLFFCFIQNDSFRDIEGEGPDHYLYPAMKYHCMDWQKSSQEPKGRISARDHPSVSGEGPKSPFFVSAFLHTKYIAVDLFSSSSSSSSTTIFWCRWCSRSCALQAKQVMMKRASEVSGVEARDDIRVIWLTLFKNSYYYMRFMNTCQQCL